MTSAPDPMELAECGRVVDAMLDHLLRTRWKPDTALNFANGAFSQPLLSGTRVALVRDLGAFDDVSLIKATSGISVQVPTAAFSASRAAAASTQLRQVLLGVVVHECTHVIQSQNSPTAFARELALKAQYAAIATPPGPTQTEALTLYIGQPLETEARAAQGAAEIYAREGRGLPRTAFDDGLASTEVARRTVTSIGPTTSDDPAVGSWWSRWHDAAFEIYDRL